MDEEDVVHCPNDDEFKVFAKYVENLLKKRKKIPDEVTKCIKWLNFCFEDNDNNNG